MRIRLFLLTLTLLSGCGPEVQTSFDTMKLLEAEIDSLLESHPEATIGIVIRDAQTGISISRNADRLFHAASTMKIPVMMEVYRQAALGRFSMTDDLEVINSFHSIVDSSLYSIEDDSDDAIYTKLGQKMTIDELVFQMITVSSNLATNLLIDFVSADSVQSTVERLGIQKMQVLRGVEDIKAFDLGLSNSTTAADLALLLEALRDKKVVSEEADNKMVDILMAQAFNEMIPAGLPSTSKVAHKTGWITAIHHDAAIVYPETGEPYVLVILTEGIHDDKKSASLGADLARLVHRALRG